MPDAARLTSTTHAVDNTDWLKTAAIIATVFGHIGFFFTEEDGWLSVFGRFAAPILFFFLGYAQSRTIPLRWILLGVILTLLESSNEDWTWVAPNILLSFALIRFVRPYVLIFVQRHSWIAFVLLVCVLFAMLPAATKIVDYGAEGWLWALFGLCQRRYTDDRAAAANVISGAQGSSSPARAATEIQSTAVMRILACLVAAVGYIWQEQVEFSLPQIQFAVLIVGIIALSIGLCSFIRGPSRIQPPEPAAGVVRFIGQYTLEIYAIQLAGSELIVKFLPDLTP
jgi:TraX protein